MQRNCVLLVVVSCSLALFGHKDSQGEPRNKHAHEAAEVGKIAVASVAAACLYGIINDQITARICPEYFTKGFHRAMVQRMSEGWLKSTLSTTKSPTILGLVWGTIATWWMGAALSVPITLAARVPFGKTPKLTMKDLIKPTAYAFGCMGITALAAGIIGYNKACTDPNFRNLFRHAANGVSEEALPSFIADACAHRSGYASGIVAGLALCGWIVHERYARKKVQDFEDQ